MDIDFEVLVNKAIAIRYCGDLFDELITELKKTCAERDWLAEMIVAVHESGYCPPKEICPVVNTNLTQKDCKDCWLRAAREAVREKQ